MVELETISILLTSTGMIIALSYYALTIRNQNRTRQAQLLMGLYEDYRSTESRRQSLELQYQEWTDYDDFFEKYGDEANPDAWAKWETKAAFFNGVGILLKENLIDIRLVHELLSSSVYRHWVFMGPILAEWRKRIDATERPHGQEPFHGFDYLYDELTKYWERNPEPGT